MTTTWTAGVVGHGVSAPPLYRKRPDLCADHDHPGVTYNPWHDTRVRRWVPTRQENPA